MVGGEGEFWRYREGHAERGWVEDQGVDMLGRGVVIYIGHRGEFRFFQGVMLQGLPVIFSFSFSILSLLQASFLCILLFLSHDPLSSHPLINISFLDLIYHHFPHRNP